MIEPALHYNFVKSNQIHYSTGNESYPPYHTKDTVTCPEVLYKVCQQITHYELINTKYFRMV